MPNSSALSQRSAGTVTARVAEVFRSWQGEGLLLGKRQVFVRLAGCEVGCRYCDTEWAFKTPAQVPVPNQAGTALSNPLSVQQLVELVNAADPLDAPGGPASVALTGGEPTEQLELLHALLPALAPRDVMLETAGLNGAALRALGPQLRWIALDLKLPTASGVPDSLERHAAQFAEGLPSDPEIFVKLIVDGDTPLSEIEQAAALLAQQLPRAVVFLQPVTPLGGSPAVRAEQIDRFAEPLLAAGLELRVVPQVHKVLKVR